MELHQLRAFQAVAEEGGFTRAATRLHTVQSNVSARIAQLEHEIGQPLFVRAARRIQLTPAGLQFLDYARRILSLTRDAESAMRGGGPPAGPFAFGWLESVAAPALTSALARFHRKHPAVELTLHTGSSDSLLGLLRNLRLDCALVAERPSMNGVAYERVLEENLVLVTRATHRTVRRASDLGRATLIAFRPECSFRERLEAWLASAGTAPARIVEAGSTEAIAGLVSAGMGVSFLPRSVAAPLEKRGKLRIHTLPPAVARVQFVLAWRDGSPANSAREALLVEFQRGTK